MKLSEEEVSKRYGTVFTGFKDEPNWEAYTKALEKKLAALENEYYKEQKLATDFQNQSIALEKKLEKWKQRTTVQLLINNELVEENQKLKELIENNVEFHEWSFGESLWSKYSYEESRLQTLSTDDLIKLLNQNP